MAMFKLCLFLHMKPVRYVDYSVPMQHGVSRRVILVKSQGFTLLDKIFIVLLCQSSLHPFIRRDWELASKARD